MNTSDPLNEIVCLSGSAPLAKKPKEPDEIVKYWKINSGLLQV